ncbi:MAG: signal peptide peptidase SppA [Pseudomonadales bacterium]
MKALLRTLFVLPWHALSWLRGALANLILFFFLAAIIYTLLHDESKVALKDNTILYVQPGRSIVEQRSYDDSLSSLLQTSDEVIPAESVLHEMVSAIRLAQHDKHIKGIVIQTDWLETADLSKLNTLRQAINTFKESKKPVIAIGDNFNQGQYLLASAADKIYLNPMGSVQLYGFSAYQSYLKDLLDSLFVNVHVFRAGQFKSFVEPFVRNDMSPEARENLTQWMNEQWNFYRTAIEQQRKLAPNSIDNFINQQDVLLIQNNNNAALLAKNYGLVDEIATRQDSKKAVEAMAGNKEPETMDASDYYHLTVERKKAEQLLDKTKRIAVIQASGEIVEGYQPAGIVGSETLVSLIREAREDEKTAAIVLRIDSPGGSAFASELIRDELAATQKEGKPVIASMGGVAASGGYWIAASANEIWASPTTITGSIGVFGVIPTLENTLSKIGVHSDGYSTSALGEAAQLDRPMNPMAARVLQQGVEFTYQHFLQLVAQGRKRTPAEIDQVAQGRVWTGAHAKTIGLVDQLGELDDAIAAAARLAKLDKYEPDFIQPELSPWDAFKQELFNSTLFSSPMLTRVAQVLVNLPALQQIKTLSQFNDSNHIYVRCLECRAPIR